MEIVMSEHSGEMIGLLLPMTAAGADAQQILEAAYPFFNKPLALVNDLFQVRGFYGPGIPAEDCERKTDTDPVKKSEWHRRVALSKEPVIDDQGGGPYRAMCMDVQYNGIAVERLAVMETIPFTDEDKVLLKQLADILALQYASGFADMISTRDHERSELLLSLIHGQHPKDDLRTVMNSLSIPETGAIRLMVFRGGHAEQRKIKHHLMSLFDAIFAEENGDLLCLTGDSEYCSKKPDIIEDVRKLALTCGAGRPLEQLQDIRSYYCQALAALQTALRKGLPFVSYEDCMAEDLIMLCTRDRDVKSFCRPEILRLAAYDREKHTELLKTFICYLECLCSVAETSRRTFLHINTVKYRLKLIMEIGDIDNITAEDLSEYLFSWRILQFNMQDR